MAGLHAWRKNKVLSLNPDTRISFVSIAQINENPISFRPNDEKALSEVGTSYTYFEYGDVMLAKAKVTPCVERGNAGIARGLLNGIGFGSSEFYDEPTTFGFGVQARPTRL